MAQLVLPRVHTMVLCDGVEESEYERDVFNLIGVRTVIESPFPAVVPLLCVFVQLTGHQGEASCRVVIEQAVSGDVIFKSEPERIAFRGPIDVVPVVYPIRDCVFPSPGLYYVQVFDDEKMIGERPLRLLEEG